VVLVIDEAQNLAPDVLEQVRMISNLETERDKLIQIILAGQPELNDLLNRHDLRQLNQRITVRCRLVSMGLEDTGDYIRHRLKVSGCRVPGLFTANAIKKIFDYSQGVPRLINVVCEQALIMAWTKEGVSITASMINHVISSSKPDTGRRRILGSIFDWLIAGR
jgi:general secretion pathway protein A